MIMMQPALARGETPPRRSRWPAQLLRGVVDARRPAGRRREGCRRCGCASKLTPILLLNEGDTEGQQGLGRQISARVQGARHGRAAAHRAEHAHLFPLLVALVSKNLSSGTCSMSPSMPPCRLWQGWGASHTAGRPSPHVGRNFVAQPSGVAVPQNCVRRHLASRRALGARPSTSCLRGKLTVSPPPTITGRTATGHT